jgi:hypothetical protein
MFPQRLNFTWVLLHEREKEREGEKENEKESKDREKEVLTSDQSLLVP